MVTVTLAWTAGESRNDDFRTELPDHTDEITEDFVVPHLPNFMAPISKNRTRKQE